MEEIYKKARAKINLTLNVLEKRKDEYHNLETIFQKISLYDELHVAKAKDHDDIKLYVNIKELEKDNIIFDTYKLLKDRFDVIKGVDVTLKKNIPMQAGFAGGSTDCACFIESMNKLFNLNLSRKEMVDIGIKLGSDVPQALYNQPVIVKGKGEIIEKINTNARYYLIVIKPKFSCNTKEMFKKLDEGKKIKQEYNAKKVRMALEEGNISNMSKNLYNIFELEVENIEDIKSELISVGAMGSLMTGTGSAVYGIFENKEKAKKAYNILKNKYETFYCISYTK